MALLRKILWFDVFVGGFSAIIGLIFTEFFSKLFGLPFNLLLIISIITFIYSSFALFLVNQKIISLTLTKVLINANWFWTIISIILFFIYFSEAKFLGIIYLILQIIIVGALAYFEGKQIQQNK